MVAAIPLHLGLAILAALISASIVRAMIAVQVMDRPDPRKAHDRPVPKGGGVGIVLAFLLGMAFLYWSDPLAMGTGASIPAMIGASVFIAVVAFLDDLNDWPFLVKFAAQVIGAVVVVASGLMVAGDGWGMPGFIPGWLLTVLWILFVTNAMNFIDGVNGLASGVTLIAGVFVGGIAAAHGGGFAYAACLLLAAGLAGFLPFNFPRARIFMGDVGSQFCGFLLAVLGVVASRLPGLPLPGLLMPLLLSGVLFDVAFTLLRRAWSREAVTQPHRGHLYQVAHRAGVSPVVVTLLHWGFAAFGGLLFLTAPASLPWLACLLAVLPQLVWAWYVTRRARTAGIGRWG